MVNSRTSCRRRPGLSLLGTRTHTTTPLLPMSIATTRSTNSTGSFVSCTYLPRSRVLDGQKRLPGEPEGEVKSRALVLEATIQGP